MEVFRRGRPQVCSCPQRRCFSAVSKIWLLHLQFTLSRSGLATLISSLLCLLFHAAAGSHALTACCSLPGCIFLCKSKNKSIKKSNAGMGWRSWLYILMFSKRDFVTGDLRELPGLLLNPCHLQTAPWCGNALQLHFSEHKSFSYRVIPHKNLPPWPSTNSPIRGFLVNRFHARNILSKEFNSDGHEHAAVVLVAAGGVHDQEYHQEDDDDDSHHGSFGHAGAHFNQENIRNL